MKSSVLFHILSM